MGFGMSFLVSHSLFLRSPVCICLFIYSPSFFNRVSTQTLHWTFFLLFPRIFRYQKGKKETTSSPCLGLCTKELRPIFLRSFLVSFQDTFSHFSGESSSDQSPNILLCPENLMTTGAFASCSYCNNQVWLSVQTSSHGL